MRPPMRSNRVLFVLGYILGQLARTMTTQAQTSATWGIFDGHNDIGTEQRPGAVEYVPDARTYRVSGGGDNMWLSRDAFQFVWKRLSGDLTLAADIQWPDTKGNPHKKAGLIIRQSLEPGSPYADAVIHGDGLTSLQFREIPDGPTREVQANVNRPQRIRLERRGDVLSLSFAREGGAPQPSGCSFRLRLSDPVYVGLAVCAHDSNALETAVFKDVRLTQEKHQPGAATRVSCTLETVAIASKDRKAIYYTTNLIEAPNWTPDGKFFLFNSQGRMHRLPIQGGVSAPVDTGFANRCNNDHGLSPDGSQLAISDQSRTGKSLIYIVPAGGGQPRQVTPLGPSYWHGWSPDGLTLAYCAERNNEFDVYTIPVAGGQERRLTTAAGLDDGPEYSPDGRYLYFNSERSGAMQIWRMKPDGSQQEQVTADDYNNWFPHPSPDGKWMVFLSYDKSVKGHPANQNVQLRLLPVAGGPIQVLATLLGGQGTINVPSWSPDSRQIAFVSYQLFSPEPAPEK